jgi:hypothetical protein
MTDVTRNHDPLMTQNSDWLQPRIVAAAATAAAPPDAEVDHKTSLGQGRLSSPDGGTNGTLGKSLSHMLPDDFQDKTDRWIATNVSGGSMQLGGGGGGDGDGSSLGGRQSARGEADGSSSVGGRQSASGGGGGGGGSGVTALMAACHQE